MSKSVLKLAGMIPKDAERKLFSLMHNEEIPKAISLMKKVKQTFNLEPSVGLLKVALTKSIETGNVPGIRLIFNRWIVQNKYYHSNNTELESLYPKMGQVILNSAKDECYLTWQIISNYHRRFLNKETDTCNGDERIFYSMQVLSVENYCKRTIFRNENRTFREHWKIYLTNVDNRFNMDRGQGRDILSYKDFPLLSQLVANTKKVDVLEIMLFEQGYVTVRNKNSYRLLLTLILLEPSIDLTRKKIIFKRFRKHFADSRDVIDYTEPDQIMALIRNNPDFQPSYKYDFLESLGLSNGDSVQELDCSHPESSTTTTTTIDEKK